MRLIFTLLLFFATTFSWAQSARRASHESWQESAKRSYTLEKSFSGANILALGRVTGFRYGVSGMPYSNRYKWEGIDKNLIPVWEKDLDDLSSTFRRLRDYRFMQGSQSTRLRRISWLYPDDGCFVRADLMDRFLEEWGYQQPAKIFVFGNLNVKTQNSPLGQVTWWYHVALTFQSGGRVFIFDPALDPRWPLYIEEWSAMMSSSPENLTFAICDHATMGPFDDCQQPSVRTLRDLENYQKNYLDMEWYRMLELKRDPIKVLGDEPPWLNLPSSRPNTTVIH